jgi:hypothetical protein
MKAGNPIRDASVDAFGNPANNTAFEKALAASSATSPESFYRCAGRRGQALSGVPADGGRVEHCGPLQKA